MPDFPIHDGQLSVLDGRQRFTVLVAGRRWGKSELCAVLLVTEAIQHKGNHAYIAPSYKMARRIQWDKVLRWAQLTGLKFIVNRSDLQVTFPHSGGVITLYGADNPDSLRGIGLRLAVLDEYEQFKDGIWDAVIRPTLADVKGEAVFIGTPDGYGELYKLYSEADAREGWARFHYRSIDNPLLDPLEIEDARANTDPRLFRQEWEASFEVPAGRIYDDFTRERNVRPGAFDKGLPVLVGLDFNLNPMSAVVCQQHGPELWVVREIEQAHSHTTRMGERLLKDYGQVEIWCDPSGNAGQHAMGVSDVQILRAMGHRVAFRTVTRETDKFNAVRSYILNAAQRVRLYVDPSCKRLISRMEQLGPDDEDDHLTDALGYLILGKFNPVMKRAA